jgi:hypothetical protein
MRLDQLVTRHRRKHPRQRWNRSDEIRAAVSHWAKLLEKPEQHTGALICLIAILVRWIEAHIGKKWIADPKTGAAVREQVGFLIKCLAPAAKEGLVVSPELQQVALELISVTTALYREPSLALAGDEWAALAMIAKDLGPALPRNIDRTIVTISEVKS